MEPEIAWYLEIARTDYPDEYRTCMAAYLERWKGEHAAAECAFIKTHDELPAWALIIESVERVNGAYIFVHHDPDKVT